MDARETDDESIVGEACNIIAQSPDGPREASDLSPEQRDKYANLILLCKVHHKLIDDQPSAYSVDRLAEIKSNHEGWVRERLGLDQDRQRDDEVYAGYVEEWATRLRLDEWKQWASWLFSHGQPCLSDEMKRSLEDIRPWLLSRVWPGRYIELESAFLNFRLVAEDLCSTFGQRAARRDQDEWRTDKFYRIDEWNPERYKRLLAEFEEHVALVEDLGLELTRAANYVCDKVRTWLVRSYRVKEGVLLVGGGPYPDLSFRTDRVEYRGGERTERPYPGLESFKTIRFDRDLCFGTRGEAQPAAPGDGKASRA